MLRNLNIGIFDSGIGGLTVLSEIVTLMPNISISYIADDLFCPYGARNEEEIIARSDAIVKLLLKFDLDLIVVACNTATAWAIASLRERYQIPFVGIEPFLNLKNHPEFKHIHGKVMVLTTSATGQSEKFKTLKAKLDPSNDIAHFSLPNLASLIEKGHKTGVDESLVRSIEQELLPLKEYQFDYAILGCTHYPLISAKIESFLGVKTINPARYVAQRVFDLLNGIGSDLLEQAPIVEQFSFLSTNDDHTIQMNTRDFYSDKINII